MTHAVGREKSTDSFFFLHFLRLSIIHSSQFFESPMQQHFLTKQIHGVM
jgi:hypothetical protein